MESLTLKSRIEKYLPLILAFLIFLIFLFSLPIPLFIDEENFMSWISGPVDLLSSLHQEGKEPFPLWIAHIFKSGLFRNDIESARYASMFMAAWAAHLCFLIARRLNLSLWIPSLLLAASSYYIFYSRIYMYEIYVIWTELFVLYTFLRGKSKSTVYLLFGGSFIGCMTKTSFLTFLATTPLIALYLYWDDYKKTALKNWFRESLWWIRPLFLGLLLTNLIVLISGTWRTRAKFQNIITLDVWSALKRLPDWVNGVDSIVIDTGWVIIPFIFLIVALLLKKNFKILLPVLAYVFTFKISQIFVRWIWSRYLIGAYGIFLFSFMLLLSEQFKNFPSQKKWWTGTIAFASLVSFLLTTGPLLFNYEQIRVWTHDELAQHFIENGNYGSDAVIESAKKFMETYDARIACESTDFPGLPEVICINFNRRFPGLSKNDAPLTVMIQKTSEKYTIPAGAKVLLDFHQKLPNLLIEQPPLSRLVVTVVPTPVK